MDVLRFIIQLGFNIVFPLFLIFNMSEFKYSKRKAAISFLITAFIIALLEIAVLHWFGRVVMERYFIILAAIPTAILLRLVSKSHISQIFFNIFTAANALYFVATVEILLCKNQEWSLQNVFLHWALFSVITWFLKRYFSHSYHFLVKDLNSSCWIISTIPFLFYALVMFLYFFPSISEPDHRTVVLFLYIIMAFVYFIIYQVFENTYARLTQEQTSRLLSLQLSMQKNRLEAQEQSMKQIRILRHDMRHFAQSITTLLKEGDLSGAASFLECFDNLFEQTTLPSFCENQLLNPLLAAQIQNARDKGITVATKLNIPNDISIDAIELSIVFANAIENAIHACENMPEKSKRHIKIVCICHPKFLLEISNTYVGKIRFDSSHLPVSSNADHGYGTKSILAFCEKYHGFLEYKAENGIFRLRILIE